MTSQQETRAHSSRNLDVLVYGNGGYYCKVGERDRVISTAAIRRRALASGLRCRRPLRVPLLSARHRTARLQWPRAHQDWLLPQWRNVLFSDESRFGLVSDDDDDGKGLEGERRTK
nr:unnamed protein product [Callosobruchus chinensis]